MDCKHADLECDNENPTLQDCQICLLAEILGELQELNEDVEVEESEEGEDNIEQEAVDATTPLE